jgi:ABC-type antimicrobial peptide transport system permease subunit
MSQGNFYFKEIKSLSEKREELGIMMGVYNKFRLKSSLAIFTLLCIFLGMVGTFWIRCNARRQEIGLMRSMGATEGRVRNQFLTEAGILVTAAFVFSLILVVNFVVMADGMAQQSVSGDSNFALVSQWLSPGVQFTVVSLITYLALLVIALVGTLIPVRRAVKVLPADALRDE